MKRIWVAILWIKEFFSCFFDDLSTLRRFLKFQVENSDHRKFAYLRACCHVLDKGMEYEKFEPGHGHSVYETAKQLQAELSKKFAKDKSFLWINDVISEYEKSQKSRILVRPSRVSKVYSDQDKNIIESFIKSRTSCRNYDGKMIDPNVINKIVELAIEAPIGCCRHTVRFYATQNPADIKYIQRHVSGMTCFSNIPCIVMVYVKSSAYYMRDRKMQYIDASLAVENFVLAAHAYNLGSTICNFSSSSSKDNKAIRNLLGIPYDESPVVAITIGHPISVPRKPLRMDISEYLKIR